MNLPAHWKCLQAYRSETYYILRELFWQRNNKCRIKNPCTFFKFQIDPWCLVLKSRTVTRGNGFLCGVTGKECQGCSHRRSFKQQWHGFQSEKPLSERQRAGGLEGSSCPEVLAKIPYLSLGLEKSRFCLFVFSSYPPSFPAFPWFVHVPSIQSLSWVLQDLSPSSTWPCSRACALSLAWCPCGSHCACA